MLSFPNLLIFLISVPSVVSSIRGLNDYRPDNRTVYNDETDKSYIAAKAHGHKVKEDNKKYPAELRPKWAPASCSHVSAGNVVLQITDLCRFLVMKALQHIPYRY